MRHLPVLFFTLFCSAFLARPATAAENAGEIPFTFHDGYIRLQARVAQSAEPLHLLLDSGAGASVMNLRTAKRLHLPLGKTECIRGVGVNAAARHLDGVGATAGNITLSDIPLAVDLTAAEQLCSEPVDGLIGVGFFRDRVVQIDYVRHVLRVNTPGTAASAGERLPVKMINGVMCVPVGVNDSNTRWVRFDTGCNDALHWVIPRPASRGDRAAVSIGFITDDADTSLASVALGKRTVHPVKTALHGTPLFAGEAGLIGNELLSQFTVTVDWPNRRVLLADAAK